jgi:hypothetical protein
MTSKKISTDSFDLPCDISEDDSNLLTSILSAVHATEISSFYKVIVNPTGYLIRGTLADDFEIDSEDLAFFISVNPTRVERVAVCNSNGKNELVIKVLNMKQRVMVTTSCSFIANKKRKYTSILS